MAPLSIQRDMAFLAGGTLYRGSGTEDERSAAEYIRKRLAEHAPDTEMDDFSAMDSFEYLFASCYAEFLIVALAASWFPRIALCYGAGVFLAYVSEFLGYRTLSRFLPHAETQNVCARFLAPRPKRLAVVIAHYDAPRESLFAAPAFLPWLRAAHDAIVACMLVVVLTCAFDCVASPEDQTLTALLVVRWTAALALGGAAAALFYTASQGEFVRGANANASGVAALLALSERVAAKPLEETDVWLVATGSDTAWMSGTRHLIGSHTLERDTAYFVNIECVGAGALHYTTCEGMLTALPVSPELVRLAASAAGTEGPKPCRLRAVPTSAAAPLTRGYPAISITGLNACGLPDHWRRHADTLANCDYASIAQAAAFADAILRLLDTPADSERVAGVELDKAVETA